MQINRDSFRNKANEIQESGERTDSPLLYLTKGETSVFVTVPEKSDITLSDMLREVSEYNIYANGDPKRLLLKRALLPIVIVTNLDSYDFESYTYEAGQVAYLQVAMSLYKQLIKQIADEDMDFMPLVYDAAGDVVNDKDSPPTVIKFNNTGKGLNTEYSALILSPKASAKYLPERVTPPASDFDTFENVVYTSIQDAKRVRAEAEQQAYESNLKSEDNLADTI